MDNETPGWDGTYPVAIRCDMTAHRAYSCAGLSQWYHEPENVTNYARLFTRELQALGGQTFGVARWWAGWVLEGAGDRKDFYAQRLGLCQAGAHQGDNGKIIGKMGLYPAARLVAGRAVC